MERYIYGRDEMSAQVVYPAENLKLMGPQKVPQFTSMQRTQCCCLDFDQCLLGAAVFADVQMAFCLAEEG